MYKIKEISTPIKNELDKFSNVNIICNTKLSTKINLDNLILTFFFVKSKQNRT